MEMVVGDAEARLAAVKDSYDAEVAALRALVRSLAADARRLDWLDATNWVHLDRTDESDNNGVGLVNSAVAVRVGDVSNGPWPMLHVTAATVREAIDVAMAAANARALADAFPVPEVPNA
jgi:hypothetical protein